MHVLFVRNCRARPEEDSIFEDTTDSNEAGKKNVQSGAALVLGKFIASPFPLRCISTTVQSVVALSSAACSVEITTTAIFALISSLVFVREAFGNVKTGNFVSKNTAR